MKLLSIFSLITSLNAADTDKTEKVNNFTLPADTTLWAGSIMDLVRDVLPDDEASQNKFQELVDWSCGLHADLPNADPKRRELTIRLSLHKLLEMNDTSRRLDYISEQLGRHKIYVPRENIV